MDILEMERLGKNHCQSRQSSMPMTDHHQGTIEESVTRFGIYKCNFDLCTCQEKEILFL